METIKNYLETMFIKLPDTAEVQRAKAELSEMMEDKYTELLNEGKSENEAIGTVISEFGNLSELAYSLGIQDYLEENDEPVGRFIALDEAKLFLSDKLRQAYMVALGVLLCITSPTAIIINDAVKIRAGEAIGILLFFLFNAVAIGIFVFSGINMSKWEFLENEPFSLDYEAEKHVKEKKEDFRLVYALCLTIGVVLCIISVVPVTFMSEIGLSDEIGAAMLFPIVGAGVFLIVSAETRKGGFTELLNADGSRSAKKSKKAKHKKSRRNGYNNRTVSIIMSVYWQTVTCIYLCWSFLSMDWHITWIIWVIAVIVNTLIDNIFALEEE